MELLLVRHGKAEPPQRTDFDRELTEAGRRRIIEASIGLKLLLGTRTTFIWSSPLPRAKQTAEILAEALVVEKVNEYHAIYSGDLDSLSQAFGDLPEDCRLIIVGHEPCLGGWSERISGVLITFKPGAVACYKISRRQPLTGKIRWFATAKTLANWGSLGLTGGDFNAGQCGNRTEV